MKFGDVHIFQREDLTDYWHDKNPEWDGHYEDGDDHWDDVLLHPPSGDCDDQSCAITWQIDCSGMDAFGPIPEREGAWRVRFWSEYYPGGPWGGPEADTGIDWVDAPETDSHATTFELDGTELNE